MMNKTLDIPGGPGRVRTYGQLIKSQLLCQLSYRPIVIWGYAPLELWIKIVIVNYLPWRARQDSNLRPTGSKSINLGSVE